MTDARCWRPGCHHTRDEHTHYRAGTDCGPCGPCGCPRFRRWPRLSDLWWVVSTAWATLRAY